MYCENCGKQLTKGAKFCKFCGESTQSMVANEIKEETPTTSHKPNIGEWSWGAFTLTWIYLVVTKYKYWWLFLILFFITKGLDNLFFLGFPILILILAIYLGFNGRKWAWEKNPHKDLNKFRKEQTTLDWVGIVLVLVGTLFIFILYW